MKKMHVFIFLVLLAVFLLAGNARAITLGSPITIWDEVSSGEVGTWYLGGVSNPWEDQEVEPGCITGQAWDLEGFFINSTTLSMVGGYDFKDGYEGWTSGDIFIDTNGDAVFGSAAQGSGGGGGTVQNTFGYEYALDLDFNTSSYTLWKLNPDTTTVKVHYGQNDEANPWKYNAGGESQGTYDFTFYENVTETDFVGGTHYGVELVLPVGLNISYAHYTYECGNDNLMGLYVPIPEPATMLMFGSGLIGLAAIGRKKLYKRRTV